MKYDKIDRTFNGDLISLPLLPSDVSASRIPLWTNGSTEHRCCPVCNADSPLPIVIRPDKFVVHHCQMCGMVYLADLPSKQDIDIFYQHYSSFKNYKFTGTRLKWFELQRGLWTNKYLSVLEATGGIKGKTVCEVGCSHGEFLSLIKHKQGKAIGMEPDTAARISLARRGIPVMEQIGLSEEFDVVCSFQVLEHLVNPADLISKISRSLVKGGRVLIAVPNGGEYVKAGPTWLGFRVDLEHVNYFDLQSISALLSSHGLFCEHYWEDNQPAIASQETYRRRENTLIRWPKRIVRALLNRLRADKNVLSQGSFVLTVLARKA